MLTVSEDQDKLLAAFKAGARYVTNILQKLQVRSRVEAALLAAQRDIAGPR